MAKGKSSRKDRRIQRQKGARAREHGLPARLVERPQRLVRQESGRTAARARDGDEDETRLSDAGEEPAQASMLHRYWERARAMPTAGKVAVLAILFVVVLAIVSGIRERTGGTARTEAAPSARAPTLPNSSLLLPTSEPAVPPVAPAETTSAANPVPAQPSSTAEAPRTGTSAVAKPLSRAAPSASPASSNQPRVAKPAPPRREDNPY
jgi:hypothetical protein